METKTEIEPFSIQVLSVEMETKTEIVPFYVFSSIFSSQDGNQNRNRTDFGFRLGSVFSVDMETKTEIGRLSSVFTVEIETKTKPFLIFGSVSVLVSFFSAWVRFGFLSPYLLQFHSNSIQPNTIKMHGQIPSNFIPIISKSNSNSIELHYANQTPRSVCFLQKHLDRLI